MHSGRPSPLFAPFVLAALLIPQVTRAGAGNSWLHTGFEDGAYRYAYIGVPNYLGAFTVEAWFRGGPQSLSPFPVICQKPAGNMFNGEAEFAFIFIASTGHLLFRVTTTAGNYQIETADNVLDGEWHHVAGVRTTDEIPRILLYVDGHLAGLPVPIAGNSLQSGIPMGVGGVEFPGYTGNYFEGDIDELRIWEVARTAPEIVRDRNREAGYQEGLGVPFHFNDYYDGYLGVGSTSSFGASRPLGVSAIRTGAGGPPISRGVGVDVAQSFQTHATPTYNLAFGHKIAARPNGHFAAVFEQIGIEQYRLDFMSSTGATITYHNSRPIDTPMALAAEGNRVYVATEVTGIKRVWAYDVTNPNSPVLFPTPAPLDFIPLAAVMQADVSNRLWLVGPDLVTAGAPNRVLVLDTTTPFSQLLNVTLLGRDFYGELYDVAASGNKVLISSTDGFVRSYLVTYGGPGNLELVGEVHLGGSAHLAVHPDAQYPHFLAATGSTLSVLNADAEVLASATVGGGSILGLAASGTRAYVTVQSGLRVIDIYPPAYPLTEVANYVTDSFRNLADPAFDPTTGHAYIAAGTAGVYGITVNSVVAAEAAPASRTLALRAAPNPVLDRSTIVLHVPEGRVERVDILDVTGRRVRELAADGLSAGEHRLSWDGRDEGGRSVAAGIYFCRAISGQKAETIRLVRLN